jgi:hypothetical protein
MELLNRHRGGLEAVANALLERETIDGVEVGRLVDEAYGQPVHPEGKAYVPRLGSSVLAGDPAASPTVLSESVLGADDLFEI